MTLKKETVIERVFRPYNAIEIPKDDISDLVNDDQLEYDAIFCCLKIDDGDLLNSLFTPSELDDFEWEIQDNKRKNRRYRYANQKEADYNQLILDEMEGRRIDIVLESLDGTYITGFLVRNQSEVIGSYLYALVGGAHFADPVVKNLVIRARELTEEVEESYRDYLDDLVRWGHI
ncbi:hypothetical protein [Exiguobacterium sp.]|uniref:hypothetical protein n=1 Tax=Exiguobacterium sp. TaxID=44751 RepID=UPI0028AB8AC1|nr:hypothetical protein [Exiguobacterium sp.]